MPNRSKKSHPHNPSPISLVTRKRAPLPSQALRSENKIGERTINHHCQDGDLLLDTLSRNIVD